MDKELTIITEPEELIAWADTFDILLNPSIEDAAILLNYMEGHDYAIGIDSDGKMYRQDVAEENGEIEPYPIDDVIDIVCEWNYELILDAEAHRSDPKDFNDYSRSDASVVNESGESMQASFPADSLYYEQDGMVVTLGNWLNGRLSCEQIEQLWCELIIPEQNKEQKESEE